jgi:CYTH domain-containing protein
VATEIERKFLVASPPAGSSAAGAELRQGYLADDAGVSVRVRISAAAATVTVKGGSGLTRTEVEFVITPAQAEALWPLTVGRRIHKHRSVVPLDHGLVAEVDRYHGDLEGLLTVEVEFVDEPAAHAFVPPAWFGPELTGDARWTNASLARHGRPDPAA